MYFTSNWQSYVNVSNGLWQCHNLTKRLGTFHLYVIVNCKVPDNFNALWQLKKKVYAASTTIPFPKNLRRVMRFWASGQKFWKHSSNKGWNQDGWRWKFQAPTLWTFKVVHIFSNVYLGEECMYFECNIVRRARVWDFFYFKGAKKHCIVVYRIIV